MRHFGWQTWTRNTRQIICRISLLLFALHAVLPVGFMPDFGALRDGRFEIIICTSAGMQSVLLDPAGQPTAPTDQTGKHAGSYTCPFGSAIAKPLAVPVPVNVAVPHAPRTMAEFADARQTPPFLPAWLPLGSRAPPPNLG